MKKLFILILLIVLISLVVCLANREISKRLGLHKEESQVTIDETNVIETTTNTKENNADRNDNNLQSIEREEEIMKMTVTIGKQSFDVSLEDNNATKEFVQMMKENPVKIFMSDYSGFEKVGSLGRRLTTSNRQITTQSGDIVLYNGTQIVIFYGSNSWSYTMIGKVDDLTGWEEALGNGDISVTFSVKNK